MSIVVVRAGYVGLVTAACLADLGHVLGATSGSSTFGLSRATHSAAHEHGRPADSFALTGERVADSAA